MGAQQMEVTENGYGLQAMGLSTGAPMVVAPLRWELLQGQKRPRKPRLKPALPPSPCCPHWALYPEPIISNIEFD